MAPACVGIKQIVQKLCAVHSRITVHKDFPDDKCLATMNKAKEALRARVIPPSNYNLRRLFPRHYLESMNSPRDSGGLVWDAASWAVSGLVGSLAAAFMTLNDVRVHNGKAFKYVTSIFQSVT